MYCVLQGDVLLSQLEETETWVDVLCVAGGCVAVPAGGDRDLSWCIVCCRGMCCCPSWRRPRPELMYCVLQGDVLLSQLEETETWVDVLCVAGGCVAVPAGGDPRPESMHGTSRHGCLLCCGGDERQSESAIQTYGCGMHLHVGELFEAWYYIKISSDPTGNACTDARITFPCAILVNWYLYMTPTRDNLNHFRRWDIY